MKNGGKLVGKGQKRKRMRMNMIKKVIGNKRKRKSNFPKTDDIDVQVADDVHIDDIEEHQWVDPQPIGKNLLCHILNLHIID